MAEQIAHAEKRRYLLLAEQAARRGSDADPALLIELSDLRLKYGPPELLDTPTGHTPVERRRKMEIEIDWLSANYAAVFRRITAVEQSVKLGRKLDYIQIALLLVILAGFLWYVGVVV